MTKFIDFCWNENENENEIFIPAKFRTSFFPEILRSERCKGVQLFKISKKIMLKNAPALVIVAVDTAENEHLKI